MTNEPSNKVTATVESARLAKRKEEGARMFAVLSFPIRGNNHLLEMLASHLQNPVDVTFEPIQASLPSVLRPPATETVEMSVDGEPAKVRRTRRHGAKPEAAADPTAPHAFVVKAGLSLDAAQHTAEELACAVCEKPLGEHSLGLGQGGVAGEPLSPAAAALIEDARAGLEDSQRKPMTVEEEREQEAARRRLVGHT